jgi:hypothetical protein
MNNNIIINSQKKCNILFLHHSTGHIIYHAGEERNLILRKLFPKEAFVEKWFSEYNKNNGTNYKIKHQFFPKENPYGWNNYPYDYYNIWVKNAGTLPFMNEPTLEILTKEYDVIIFKHCYPVSNLEQDNRPDINSPKKTLENYKLQYEAIKQKLYEFPQTKFIIWTGAIQVKNNISQDQAKRAKEFFEWVKNEWDQPDDNIYIWDFYSLQTEGSLYLIDSNAQNINNSHPGKLFAKKVAPLFCQKITDVIYHNI